MAIGLDLSHITPEDIKEATAALNKEISAQVNDAMKKGLTGSLKKYSQVISESVSSGLKSSLTQTFKKDISREFADLFSSRSFIDNVSKGLKVAIADAFKTMPTMKVDVQPVLAPGGMPALPSTGATSASAGTGIDASQLQGKMSDSGMEVVSVQALMAGAYRKLIDSSELLNASLKDVNEQFKSLTDKEKERFEIAEKEVKDKKHKEVDPATDPKKDEEKGLFGGKIDIGKSFNLFVGGILTKAILGMTGIIKDTFKNYYPRQQEALQSSGVAVSSKALASSPELYMKFASELKEKMKTEPILAKFGGDKGYEAFMAQRRAGKGIDTNELGDTKAFVDSMKRLTASAVLSGMTLEEFSQKITANMYAFGMSEDAAKTFVEGMAEQAKKMQMPYDSLKSYMDSANGSLRLWGHGLSESYGIATRFGKSLEEGRKSMGDIIQFAGSLHKTGEGQSLFLVDAMSRNQGNAGQRIAEAIKKLSKGDPLAERNLFNMVSQGTKGIAGQLGVGGTDRDVMRTFRTGATQQISSMSKEMTGNNPFAEKEMFKKLWSSIMGGELNMSEENLAELRKTYGTKGQDPTNWAAKPKPVIGKDGKLEDPEKVIMDAMDSAISPMEKFTFGIKGATAAVTDFIMSFTKDKNKIGAEYGNIASSALQEHDFTRALEGVNKMKEVGQSGFRNPMTASIVGELGKDLSTKPANAETLKQIGQVLTVFVASSDVPGEMGTILSKLAKKEWSDDMSGKILNFVKDNKAYGEKRAAIKTAEKDISTSGLSKGIQ